jgi:phenylacetate-CoA ligase
MRKIRGVWFMPVMVEDVVRGFPEIDEFQTELTTIDALDTLVVRIEVRPAVPESEHNQLAERFRSEFRRQVQINPVVNVVESGSLPRFEMKARRFADVRPQTAGVRL